MCFDCLNNDMIAFREGPDGSVRYYSTYEQLGAVILLLDRNFYEADLMVTIDELSPDMDRQMAVTVLLTDQGKSDRAAVIYADNGRLFICIFSNFFFFIIFHYADSCCRLNIFWSIKSIKVNKSPLRLNV